MARPRAARLQVGYDQGRRGEKPSQVVANDPDLLAAYDEGLSDHEDAQAPKRVPRQRIPRAPRFADAADHDPTNAAPAADTPANPAGGDEQTSGGGAAMPSWLTSPPSIPDGSGLLLGMFGYALAVNFLRGGPAQMKAWVTAKFLNKPAATPPTAGSTPVIPGGPGLLGGILGGIQNANPGLGAGPPTVPRFGPQ